MGAAALRRGAQQEMGLGGCGGGGEVDEERGATRCLVQRILAAMLVSGGLLAAYLDPELYNGRWLPS